MDHVDKVSVFPLTNAKDGSCVRIDRLSVGRLALSKLNQMGLREATTVEVLRHAPFDGPVLVRLLGREVALGHGVAQKVFVTEILP